VPQLEFSEKYDVPQTQSYYEKHHEGIGRLVSNWREVGMPSKALKLVGHPDSVLDLPTGSGRFWGMLAEMRSENICG
jgi:hypothetical protein